MINKFKEINWNPSIKERRGFGRLLMMGFPFVGLFWAVVMGLKGLSAGKGWDWSWALFYWIAGMGFGVGLVCYLLPMLARPLYCIWFFLVCLIDLVIMSLLLPAFFYTILMPFGVLLRLLGKNPTRKHKEAGVKTYWIDVEKPKDLSQYYRQF